MTSLISRPLATGLITTAAILLSGCHTMDTTMEKTMSPSYKQQALSLLESIETGDPEGFAVVNADQYIQHNLAVPDGLSGLRAVLAQAPKDSIKTNTVRVFQDGDYVFTHSEFNFFGPKIGFDIYRFENGKIVEHWDNLQEKPAAPNPSGRTMIDGATVVTDLDKTETNKALVRAFLEDIFINGRMDKFAGYFNGENYLQHNPLIADRPSGLLTALKQWSDQGITVKYERIHRILGEGNFVLAVGEGSFGGKPIAFYDLYRVENGKLAEHWDVLEEIPPRAQWKNTNGKF